MIKIPMSFTKAECPICLKLLDLSTNQDLLAWHIRADHRDVSLIPIIRSLHQAHNKGLPDGLEIINFDDAATMLANTCLDIANKRGQNRLRRQLKKRKY